MFPEIHLQFLSRCVTGFCQILSAPPQNTITSPPPPPKKICDKGRWTNYVFNLASDFYRVTGRFFSGRSQCHKLDRSWWALQDRTWKGCRTGCRTKRCPLALSVGQVGCVKMTDFSTKILLCLAMISIFVVFCRIKNLFHKWTTQQ